MNEQLVVKNFGPIKDATVDFKRVTVFIGPTGGGKSTLAKLAAIAKESNVKIAANNVASVRFALEKFALDKYILPTSSGSWRTRDMLKMNFIFNNPEQVTDEPQSMTDDFLISMVKKFVDERGSRNSSTSSETREIRENNLFKQLKEALANSLNNILNQKPTYIPSERIFVAALSYSWPGLLRDDIGLPKTVLEFANDFSTSRKDIRELEIAFLNARYLHHDGQDYIKIPESEVLFRLHETASGLQSVTPLLVLLEHLSRNTEQAQSFIIEEPELNLYPTAQQGLLNWLVEKCTKGENDLTITTHSPYLLAHFNLLLYAHQVAKNHPDRADDVAKIVPRESWIDPKEFAAYHVEGQQENGVRSIVNPETGLISYNGLDSTASAETAEFEKLLDINAGLEVE